MFVMVTAKDIKDISCFFNFEIMNHLGRKSRKMFDK